MNKNEKKNIYKKSFSATVTYPFPDILQTGLTLAALPNPRPAPISYTGYPLWPSSSMIEPSYF